MFLDWPVDPFARFDHSRPSLFPEVPNDEQQRGALPASTRSRWRQNALHAPPQVLQRIAGWDGYGPFLTGGLRCITWNTRGLIGPVFSKQKNREFKHKYLKKLFINNNIVCPGGSAICIHKDLLPEDAIVTHVITCQGRDHVVNVQSGRRNLVVVNVHFEPELTLGRLRERLRLIAPHWPPYPNAVGIIMGDLNICEPEEGRFNVWNLTLTDGDTGKAALFHALFPHVLEMAQPDHTWRDSSVIGIIRTL